MRLTLLSCSSENQALLRTEKANQHLSGRIGFGSRAAGPTQVRGHVILTLHVLDPFMKHKHVRYTNTMLSEKQE